MVDRKVVGWAVKDYADGWIVFGPDDEVAALNLAVKNGAAFKPIFEPAHSSTQEREP